MNGKNKSYVKLISFLYKKNIKQIAFGRNSTKKKIKNQKQETRSLRNVSNSTFFALPVVDILDFSINKK